jgi:hypothetical protein
MAERQSILSKVSTADIRREPFAHLLIENALDAELFETLSREFPSVETVTGNATLKNGKAGINALDVIDNPGMSAAWRAFCAYHASQAFFDEVVSLFGKEINTLYPTLEKDFGKPLEKLSAKPRIVAERKGAHRQDDFVLDCQIMLDDTSDLRICRGPHVDAVEEIFAGLLYFRHPEDQSNGGELCVLRAKNPAELFPNEGSIRIDQRPAEINEAKTEIVTKIPYAENTAVFFINSPKSLHKVTMRTASPVPRRHVNIIGESYSLKQRGLFQILKPGAPIQSPTPPSLIRRAMNKLRRSF